MVKSITQVNSNNGSMTVELKSDYVNVSGCVVPDFTRTLPLITSSEIVSDESKVVNNLPAKQGELVVITSKPKAQINIQVDRNGRLVIAGEEANKYRLNPSGNGVLEFVLCD